MFISLTLNRKAAPGPTDHVKILLPHLKLGILLVFPDQLKSMKSGKPRKLLGSTSHLMAILKHNFKRCYKR
jgi:hypothetical protein